MHACGAVSILSMLVRVCVRCGLQMQILFSSSGWLQLEAYLRAQLHA